MVSKTKRLKTVEPLFDKKQINNIKEKLIILSEVLSQDFLRDYLICVLENRVLKRKMSPERFIEIMSLHNAEISRIVKEIWPKKSNKNKKPF